MGKAILEETLKGIFTAATDDNNYCDEGNPDCKRFSGNCVDCYTAKALAAIHDSGLRDCNNCELSQSLSEALNSGNGAYKP